MVLILGFFSKSLESTFNLLIISCLTALLTFFILFVCLIAIFLTCSLKSVHASIIDSCLYKQLIANCISLIKFLFFSNTLFNFQDPGPLSNYDIFKEITFDEWSENEVAGLIRHFVTLLAKCEKI